MDGVGGINDSGVNGVGEIKDSDVDWVGEIKDSSVDGVGEIKDSGVDGVGESKTGLQTTQHTSGGAVTADSSCCANCVEFPRPQLWGPDLPCLGHAGSMRTRWLAGTAAHKSG